MHITEMLLEYLATIKIRRLLTAWAGHRHQHPPEHTEELSDYLLQPKHQGVYCSQENPTENPKPVRVHALVWLTATGPLSYGPNPNLLHTPPQTMSPSNPAYWVLELPSGKIFTRCVLSSSTVYILNPNPHNLPHFCSLQILPSPNDPLSFPFIRNLPQPYAALNVGEWHASVSIEPKPEHESPPTGPATKLSVTYSHPQHGTLTPICRQIADRYDLIPEKDIYAFCETAQTLFHVFLNQIQSIQASSIALIGPATLSFSKGPLYMRAHILFTSRYNPKTQLRLKVHPHFNLNTPISPPKLHVVPELLEVQPHSPSCLQTACTIPFPTSLPLSHTLHSKVEHILYETASFFALDHQNSLSC